MSRCGLRVRAAEVERKDDSGHSGRKSLVLVYSKRLDEICEWRSVTDKSEAPVLV